MNKKRLLAGSLVALSLIAITSISTTFAWYFNGVYAQIDAVTIALKSQDAFKISTSDDISTFKSQLTKDDLMKVDAFIPVTSMYSERWIGEKSTTPKFAKDFSHVKDDEEVTYSTEGVFSQAIYFYSDSDVTVTLDGKTFSFLPNVEANEKAYEEVKDLYPELSKEEIVANLNNVVKSLRLSVLYTDENTYNYVIVDPYKESITTFAGILDCEPNGFFDYDTLNKKELLFGDYHNEDKIVYDEASSTDIPYQGQLTCFNSGHKANVELLNFDKSIANGLVVGEENSVSLSELEEALSIPLKAGTPNKVIISIYLEGWDRDNTLLSESASFLLDISFKIEGEIL